MLGIIKNKNKTFSWFEVLTYLPQGIVEVLSLGRLSMDNWKIIRNYDPWWDCAMFFLGNLVIVLSFGYLTLEQKL